MQRSGAVWRVLGLLVLSMMVVITVAIATSIPVQAQAPELSRSVQELVRVRGAKVGLTHVRIIDGDNPVRGRYRRY